MKNPFQIGERLYLRPWSPDDAPQVTSWMNDPQVWSNLAQHRPKTQASIEKFLEQKTQSETDVLFFIAHRETDALLGCCGLHHLDLRNRSATLGMYLGDPTGRGKGYGTEALRLVVRYAFDTLNLHRIELDVYEDNPQAIRCYEKAGFVREGLKRQHTFRNGRWTNTVIMAVLRDER